MKRPFHCLTHDSIIAVDPAAAEICAEPHADFYVRHSLTYGRRAYTLVEMLIAVTLTLIIMAFVMQIFGMVSDSVSNSRALLEMNGRLRWTAERLRKDLDGATAEMVAPLSPDANRGYFQLNEGNLGTNVEIVAINSDKPDSAFSSGYEPDSTVIDKDDMLTLTVRSREEPFTGRALIWSGTQPQQESIQSPLAEISWFVRGTTLYRRVLLIKPEFDWYLSDYDAQGEAIITPFAYSNPNYNLVLNNLGSFYNNFDLSVHLEGYSKSNPSNKTNWRWVPNTLADLTKRENRFARSPYAPSHFPFNVHAFANWYHLGLPTLSECSSQNWWPGTSLHNVTLTPMTGFGSGTYDAWVNPLPYQEVDQKTGSLTAISGPRVAEDVILTNVVGFDVKVWDPGAPQISIGPSGTEMDLNDDVACLVPGDPGYSQAIYNDAVNNTHGATIAGYGAYVDLGYWQNYTPLSGAPTPWFNTTGNPKSGLTRVYDTWSTHYEKDGLDQDDQYGADQGTDGFDNDNDGKVDEADEREAPAPYERPLRGLKITIRTIEPDSHQVRDTTIYHSFLPQ